MPRPVTITIERDQWGHIYVFPVDNHPCVGMEILDQYGQSGYIRAVSESLISIRMPNGDVHYRRFRTVAPACIATTERDQWGCPPIAIQRNNKVGEMPTLVFPANTPIHNGMHFMIKGSHWTYMVSARSQDETKMTVRYAPDRTGSQSCAYVGTYNYIVAPACTAHHDGDAAHIPVAIQENGRHLELNTLVFPANTQVSKGMQFRIKGSDWTYTVRAISATHPNEILVHLQPQPGHPNGMMVGWFRTRIAPANDGFIDLTWAYDSMRPFQTIRPLMFPAGVLPSVGMKVLFPADSDGDRIQCQITKAADQTQVVTLAHVDDKSALVGTYFYRIADAVSAPTPVCNVDAHIHRAASNVMSQFRSAGYLIAEPEKAADALVNAIDTWVTAYILRNYS